MDPVKEVSIKSMSRNMHKSRVFGYAYIVLLAAELCIKMCLYMQQTNITLYILDGGGTTVIVGAVTAAQLISSLIFRPIAGTISDRSRLIPMLFGAIGYMAVTSIWLMGVPVAYAPLVAAMQGMCFSFTSTGVYSLAADVVPEEHVTHCYTYLNLVETAAAAVSAALAIHLRNISGNGLVFRVVFGISLAVVGCMMLLSLTSWKKNGGHYYHPSRLFSDYRKAKRAEKARGVKSEGFFAKVVDKNAFRPAAFYMMIMFAGQAVIGYLVAYGKAENIPNPGVFFTVQAVTVYIASLFVGHIDERFGSKAVLLPGFAFYFLAMTTALFPLSYTTIFISGIFFGLGVALVQPELSSLAVRMAGAEHRGKANSTVGVMMDIGGASAGLIFGFMIDTSGYRSIYAFAALIIVLIAVVYIIMNKKKQIL